MQSIEVLSNPVQYSTMAFRAMQDSDVMDCDVMWMQCDCTGRTQIIAFLPVHKKDVKKTYSAIGAKWPIHHHANEIQMPNKFKKVPKGFSTCDDLYVRQGPDMYLQTVGHALAHDLHLEWDLLVCKGNTSLTEFVYGGLKNKNAKKKLVAKFG